MILLIYDSLFGNTAIIAHHLAESAREKGKDVLEVKVDETEDQLIKKADILIVGSPTQSFNASKPMLEFLDRLESESIRNKPTLVFDTRIDLNKIDSKFLRWLVNRGGFATAPISKKLKRKGAKIIGAEGFIVTDREGPLREGELERAKAWITSLI